METNTNTPIKEEKASISEPPTNNEDTQVSSFTEFQKGMFANVAFTSGHYGKGIPTDGSEGPE